MMPIMFLAELPTKNQMAGLFLLAVFLLSIRHSFVKLLAIALLSLSWGIWNANSQVQQIKELQGRKQNIVAIVQTVDLVSLSNAAVWFQIVRVNDKRVFPPINFRAKWDERIAKPMAGQRMKMSATLRPVHGALNEGGFDVQRWALSQHVPFSATIHRFEILESESNFRQKFIYRVLLNMPDIVNKPILVALAFGEKGLIEASEQLLLQQTGIAHLVAISGLHIAIAALFGWWLARVLQYFLPIKWIDYRFPLVVSEISLLIYTWLSGGNAPALRAAIAVTFWILLRFNRVRCHPWQIWIWCIALLLIAEPMNLLSDSFWLSCFAVGALVFWFQWVPLKERFRHKWYWALFRWGHLQAGMTLLLMPLQIGIFHGWNISSFLANIWAVPIVSLITVPLVLVALIINIFPMDWLQLLLDKTWLYADYSLSAALWGIKPFSNDWHLLSNSYLFFCLGGWIGIIFWRIYPLKHSLSLAFSLCAVTLVWFYKEPAERWRIDMLDVGHGLSVLISKNGKGVLYDTGNRWDGGSAAKSNILPFMNWRNIQLEQIIISHSDMDHRGGQELIQSVFPAASIRTSSPSSRSHLPCIAGEKWRWENLTFSVLWPEKTSVDARNDDSCVIRVTDGSFSLLLTGDIEARAEKELTKKWREGLRSTVLQVPHHGSNTSSTPPFLRAVNPVATLNSVSRFNKWHLPARKVVSRYNKARYDWHSTSESGQLSVFVFDDYWAIKGFREQLNPRWYHHRFGVSADNE